MWIRYVLNKILIAFSSNTEEKTTIALVPLGSLTLGSTEALNLMFTLLPPPINGVFSYQGLR